MANDNLQAMTHNEKVPDKGKVLPDKFIKSSMVQFCLEFLKTINTDDKEGRDPGGRGHLV